jgi:hypothetical protein
LRIRNPEAVAFALVGGTLMLVGDFTSGTGLADLLATYVVPSLDRPFVVLAVALLLFLAFTSSFAAFFCFLAAPYIARNRLRRARPVLGVGISLSLLGFLGRTAYFTLTEADPLGYVELMTSTLTGLGFLSGFTAKLLVGRRFMAFRRALAQALR